MGKGQRDPKARRMPAEHPRGDMMSRVQHPYNPNSGDIGESYTPSELEFMLAMERYMRRYDRSFPTCRDVLIVAKSLGYERSK